MFSKWRHRPSLQALISRKQRKMIIETLVTIKIQMAAFGLTKKKASPTIIIPHGTHAMGYFRSYSHGISLVAFVVFFHYYPVKVD